MSKFLYIINIIFLIRVNPALGETEAGMPQLNPEFWISQVFWLILIFSTLYIIIWKLIIPKITESLENRKKHIVDDLDEAQKIKSIAEKKLDEYKSIIENSKNQAKKIILDNKRKMEQDISDKRKKFEQEIQTELKNAENQIKDFKNSSIGNINKMSIEISNEIIKNTLNIDTNISNVTAIVEEVSKKKLGKIS
jgi:F-type H+-transporting ATPase subunit b